MRGKPLPLPDFCHPPLVFSAMVIGQLAVVIALLAPGRSVAAMWEIIGPATVYAQWLVLVTVAVLCLGRRWLEFVPGGPAWIAAWVVVVLCALVLTGLVLRVDDWLVMGLLPGDIERAAFRWQTVLIAAAVGAAFLRYLWVTARWQAGERARSQARVRALQARIRPHFLFNTLNSIAALVPGHPREAERAIEDLSDLFRGSLREADRPVPLDEELDLVRKYLDIESLRLGDRLAVEWALADFPEGATVLPFSLQLLVENAVRHGIQPRPEGGRVTIRGESDGRNLSFEISNPRPDTGPPPASNGIALNNLRERLDLVYAGAAGLALETAGETFRARMSWPC